MLVYDLEIKNPVPPKNPSDVEPNIVYCDGWHDYANMGISCLCVYDLATKRSRVFLEDNLKEFEELAQQSDCLVGFNNMRFDNRVLFANGINLPAEKCYDLLTEIWRGLGLGPDYEYRTHGGYSLDAMSYANFRSKKDGHGSFAPIWYQYNEIGKVVDYCLKDVHLTHRLLEMVINRGWLWNPKDDPRCIYLRKPCPEANLYG